MGMEENAVVIYAPTLLQDSTPVEFDVGERSVVVELRPAAGEVLTEADSFELRKVFDRSPTRTLKQYNLDKTAILLGATLPQHEIMIRGTYILDKISNTTESVGAYRSAGFEELGR